MNEEKAKTIMERPEDFFRGNEFKMVDGESVYVETGKPTNLDWRKMACGLCGEHRTPEGHDPCLGTIPDALNACCGHGHIPSAYIQYEGYDIRGQAVFDFMATVGKENDDE